MDRQINLLYGAPEIYDPVQPRVASAASRRNKILIGVLAGLLVVETLAFGGYLAASGAFEGAFNRNQARPEVLGIATESAQVASTSSATATPTATVSATVSPTLTKTPSATGSATATSSATASAQSASDQKTYTVATGDNWWTIVRKQCNNPKNIGELVNFNVSKTKDNLQRGQTVTVYCSL